MREIKFRGKRIDNGEWIYGFFVFDEFKGFEGKAGIAFTDSPLGFEVVEVDIKTVGQYTGLKDKNNIEIYEGDTYHQGDKNILYVVEYTQDCSFMGRQIRTKGSRVGLSYWQDRIEVIGNIHDNPELLEVV